MLELKSGIDKYIDFYNTNRYHSSLAYQVPDDVYFQKNNILKMPLFNQQHQATHNQ